MFGLDRKKVEGQQTTAARQGTAPFVVMKHNYVDKVKEMRCGKWNGNKCQKHFSRMTSRKVVHFKDLKVCIRIILKCILKM
jgi:hypothetical protein